MDEGMAVMMRSVADAIDGVSSSLSDIKDEIAETREVLEEIKDAMCEKNGGTGIYVRADCGVTNQN